MVTHVHLVRHGHHALLNHVLCGRMPDVELDVLGCRQMTAVARDMKRIGASIVHASPQRRALQSAGILASECGLSVEIVPALDEIDMGAWTGAKLADLAREEAWARWNNQRGSARPPGGETMRAVQSRVVSHVERLRSIEGAIIIVSHAEPIRAALMHYLGIPLDRFHAVQVDPARLNTILLDDRKAVVVRINGAVSVWTS